MSAAIVMFGLALVVGTQLAIAGIAFRKSAISGLMCLFVPLYVYVFANRATTNPWFMRLWYAGVGLLVLGAVVVS